MHFRNSIAAAALLVSPLAFADETASSSEVARPQFTPTDLKAPFLEQFTDNWDSRWKTSNAKKENDKSTEDEWQFIGTWDVEEPKVLKGIEGDKGLVLKDKAAHHAISAKFPKKIDPKGKDLVVQYEVKFQGGIECGGAYMKLLKDTKALHQEEFSNASPYVIMFGPDKCGATNKVHFIFKHKNPKTGEYEEKHMISPPSISTGELTGLYTLIVRKDNSFEMLVNNESKKNGTLLEDFSPAVNPPEQIEDPKDKKPESWVEEAKIPDPDAVKPEDWDEDAPAQIPDMDAEKPEDWLDDEPQMIPDPEATKPEDWDDEEDGDFAPPMVPNPRCAEVSGCGEWVRPMKSNPEYKGKWKAALIDNPLYKGLWAAAKIANPNYFNEKTPSNFEPMGAIGFELWSMQNDILFDNIYIGHSIEDAAKFREETWDVKRPIETAEDDISKAAKAEEAKKVNESFESTFLEDPVAFAKTKVNTFLQLVQIDPMLAIKSVPEVSGVIGVLLATILVAIFGGIGAGAAKSPAVQEQAKKVKKAAGDAKDKASDAVASGADKVQAEVNKRSTRSADS